MTSIVDIHGRGLTVAIGTDHGGFKVKGDVAESLRSRGHKVVDCGPFVYDAADDYSDYGADAAPETIPASGER